MLSFGVSKSTQILIIKGNFLGLVIWWTLSSNCSISLPRGNSISKLDFSQINAYVYCLYKYFCDFTLAVESSTGKVRIKAELKPPPPALPVYPCNNFLPSCIRPLPLQTTHLHPSTRKTRPAASHPSTTAQTANRPRRVPATAKESRGRG